MRKVISAMFLSLDGVMESPARARLGGEEDVRLRWDDLRPNQQEEAAWRVVST